MTFLGSIFVASLLGSAHCAGMCGVFAMSASACQGACLASRLSVAYNGGRLMMYVMLGGVAGLLGGWAELGATAIGLQRVTAWLGGALLILLGITSLPWVQQRVRIPRLLRGAGVTSLTRRLLRADVPPVTRSVLIGMCASLLPCGWLYAFVAAAAATGQVLSGMLAMAAFWAGTVPILLAVGLGAGRWLRFASQRMRTAAALCLVLVGVMLVSQRAFPTLEPRTDALATPSCCPQP